MRAALLRLFAISSRAGETLNRKSGCPHRRHPIPFFLMGKPADNFDDLLSGHLVELRGGLGETLRDDRERFVSVAVLGDGFRVSRQRL
jgi:hypothetical protein